MTRAKTHVCLQTKNQILMVVQEDQLHISPYADPEPPLVASAIAAFQFNNEQKIQRREKPLESWVYYYAANVPDIL